jgi:two-component system, cell cycle sensor histidine kinase DivJ
VAQASLRFVKLAAEKGGVRLTKMVAPEAARIFADKRALKQILVNLLSNGIKFTPRGGQVALEAREYGHKVEILVRDSGIGIAKADIEKLGKPFAQAENAAIRAKEGTGLGLALVKSLAAMHGGEVVLESALGIGTTVRVLIPSTMPDAQDGSSCQALRGAA